jgi:hypothetical protein
MYFSTINSFAIKQPSTSLNNGGSPLVVARCSTCLISFYPDFNNNFISAKKNYENKKMGGLDDSDSDDGDDVVLESCLGNRIPPDSDGRNSSSLSSSSSSSSSSLLLHPVFLENGFQIRGALSPDGEYYLCPSSKNPWNGSSSTLVVGGSKFDMFVFLIMLF